jgi:transcriptional regulator with XRE-family HTH domain
MEREDVSLNRAAMQAGLSPSFLSRILNRKRGLPSDETILRLAAVLNIQPRERLLIEAGRIPDDLKGALSHPHMPELLRATGKLTEGDLQEVVKTVHALALKRHREKKSR